ncbi:S41 family peptidase [Halalkalibacter sp. APA_J-10(15)]|uniref:S41 family peptidase n=1 Tax=Halalkalibacter sp. APA_J-10(15) TaxID=2933805 RepID=UPI001FF5D8DD|nr:S41 family peptidase [Halalkalibacter sp. APA_J-10(15)]MCK0472979.1 S41 family peptidase [Halalkalibacter sp. APA_J-10(15)]
MKKGQIIMILAVIVGLGAYAVFLQPDPTSVSTPDIEEQVEAIASGDEELLEKFEAVRLIIEEHYVEDVDHNELLQGAIDGMLEALGDPYSVYMDQEEASQFTESLGSHFEGIGAEVMMSDGKVTIVTPMRESPAERAGLLPNDQIIEIDGEATEGLSLQEAVMQIRGEKGTTVHLTIERETASELVTIPVVRDEIPIETVRHELIERDGQEIGLIEIISFSIDTAERFEAALEELESKGMDGLIIDVRGNPGGYLDQVEEIGKLIIPNQQPIVQTESRSGEKMRFLSPLNDPKPYPIVGVTDRASASASEILSAALIEAGEYDVIGETTFGKGTVQNTIPLGDGSQLKLSVFKWLTSAGNDINGVGVEPTIEVMQPDYFYTAPVSVDVDPYEEDMLSEQIRSAQIMLNGLGYDPGREDGYFSTVTTEAVRAFQEENDLDVTGVIDEDTASTLHERVVEEVRERENDRQLNQAIEVVIEQINE